MLTKEQILQADDLRFVDVEVSEWNGSVRVRVMTAKEREGFQKSLGDAKGKIPEGFFEKMVIACAVDGAGNRLFEDKDLDALSKKSAVALAKVFQAAVEANGMTDKSVEAIKND